MLLFSASQLRGQGLSLLNSHLLLPEHSEEVSDGDSSNNIPLLSLGCPLLCRGREGSVMLCCLEQQSPQ